MSSSILNKNKEYKILVVDDDPIHIQIIVDYLEEAEESYKIYQAVNGKTAIKIAKSKLLDLVVADWDMPGMSGIILTKKLKKMDGTKDIPVIMATGVMTTSENLKTAFEAGAVDFIRKPIDKIELIARLRSMLALSDSYKHIKELNQDLQEALSRVKTLSGLLPICSQCKKIRSDEGYWTQIESYIRDHSDADFSHGICPDCFNELYPDY